MGANTAIEWTDHTWNPWRGCAKVSPGCAMCYAETLSARNPDVLGEWGPPHATTRVIAAEPYWDKPLSWNANAERDGVPQRVFVASLADVFEDAPQVVQARARVFDVIERTPWLVWLLLTKRPGNVMAMVPDGWTSGFPPNVWLGTSVEDQTRADERIPPLLAAPAAVRFLSCEPLLGPVDLGMPADHWGHDSERYDVGSICVDCTDPDGDGELVPWTVPSGPQIDWVIVGGESGPGARPMHPAWARSLRDQAAAAQVPFLFKQWGRWAPRGRLSDDAPLPVDNANTLIFNEDGNTRGAAGGSMSNRLCEFSDGSHCEVMEDVGKKDAGRLLDGITHDGVPALPVPAG